MSDAIKKLHDYLAKSPSVVYPEDVFAYLPAIEAENAKLREERNHWHVEQVHAYSNWENAYRRVSELESENAELRELCSELLRMAESNDPDFLHWPEIHDELRKVGVEIVQL